jgi:hypothetical protein
MRYGLILVWILFWSASSAMAQISIGIVLPGVSIGINLPVYPELVRVPGYPVYYAPQLDSNFFFYDGMYWVYQGDNWYASSWYNGPWGLVDPDSVPLFVLRVPVRYYRHPPEYFRGWRADAPPRWGEHWGNQWEQRRSGWDRWNHKSAPAPAPLPAYQRKYSGNRYPQPEQQHALQSRNYRYQPRDAVVRQHYQEQGVRKTPAPSERGPQGAPQERSPRQQDTQRSNPPAPLPQSRPAVPIAPPPPPLPQSRPAVPIAPPPQRGGGGVQRPAPTQAPAQRGGESVDRPAPTRAPAQQRGPAVQDQSRQPQQGAAQREKQAPRPGPESVAPGKGTSPERGRAQGQEKDRAKAEERGQEPNK